MEGGAGLGARVAEADVEAETGEDYAGDEEDGVDGDGGCWGVECHVECW